MRVAVLGGSAPSTPQLLADPRIVADGDTVFALHGRSIEHLRAVQRAARILAPPMAPRLAITTDLAEAVRGADLVIVQVRVDGLAAREHDERFSLPYGIPGDEGLGPGGFAAAWRTWPVLERIAATVVSDAPAARVVLLSAPLGILTRCAIDAFPALEIVGLCELPTVVLNEIRATLGGNGVAAEYAGVNHLGWFTRITVNGEDAIDRFAEARRDAPYPDERAIRSAQAVPLPYVRLQERRVEVVREQRCAELPRAAVLKRIAERAYAAFERGDASEIGAVLEQRPAPWYAHAVVPFIEALRDAKSDALFFLTTRNRGYLPVLEEAVVEIPHRFVDRTFIAAPPVERIPYEIARNLEALVRYESIAADVVTSRNPDRIASALAAHPWVPSPEVAQALTGAVLSSDVTAQATGPT